MKRRSCWRGARRRPLLRRQPRTPRVAVRRCGGGWCTGAGRGRVFRISGAPPPADARQAARKSSAGCAGSAGCITRRSRRTTGTACHHPGAGSTRLRSPAAPAPSRRWQRRSARRSWYRRPQPCLLRRPPRLRPKRRRRWNVARDAAQALPCSVLRVAGVPDGLRVSGLAPAGQELDRLLSGTAAMPGASPTTSRASIASPARRSRRWPRWCGGPGTARRRHSPSGLDRPRSWRAARGSGSMSPRSLPALYVDLYQADGSVRHLLRPAPSGATEPAACAMGCHAAAPARAWLSQSVRKRPLDLGARPDTERAADYLEALQTRLQRAAVPLAADLAMVTVRAAEPAVSKAPQPRPTMLRSDRCANIVSRAQLGETLSDAEVAALRTECRS